MWLRVFPINKKQTSRIQNEKEEHLSQDRESQPERETEEGCGVGEGRQYKFSLKITTSLIVILHELIITRCVAHTLMIHQRAHNYQHQ